jgi:prevent-host-death family protein
VEVVEVTTFSAREFNRDVSAAKRAADEGPVVITDRGEPAYVLLSFVDYSGMRERRSLVDVLQMDEDVDFEPVVSRALPRAAEL